MPWGWPQGKLDKFKSKIHCTQLSKEVPTDLLCDECHLSSPPSLDHLEQCAAASDENDFRRIQNQVTSEGGNCKVSSMISFKNAVSECVKVRSSVEVSATPSPARLQLAD